jgi:hypothetical protein
VDAQPVEAGRRERNRRSWTAVGIGEAAVLVAGFIALSAVASEIDCIGLGCSEDTGTGAVAIFLLVTAAATLTVGLCWSAAVSGRPLPEFLARGVLAGLTVGVAAWLAAGLFGAEGFSAGLVLGAGIAGTIVVREPAPSSRYLRWGAIFVLSLLAIVGDSLLSSLFVVLIFPAIGIADTVSLSLEADHES